MHTASYEFLWSLRNQPDVPRPSPRGWGLGTRLEERRRVERWKGKRGGGRRGERGREEEGGEVEGKEEEEWREREEGRERRSRRGREEGGGGEGKEGQKEGGKRGREEEERESKEEEEIWKKRLMPQVYLFVQENKAPCYCKLRTQITPTPDHVFCWSKVCVYYLSWVMRWLD